FNKMRVKKTFLGVFISLIAVWQPVSASVVPYLKTADGVVFTLDQGQMLIHVVKDDIIQVQYTRNQNLGPKKSLVILPGLAFKVPFTVSENKTEIVISTQR